MFSLATDAESDIQSDEEYKINPTVRTGFQQLYLGDVLNFYSRRANLYCSGRVESKRENAKGAVVEIGIHRLDPRLIGKVKLYKADQLGWIFRQCNVMPGKSVSLSDLHPRMHISTTAACGSSVSGWVKRVENGWIFLDKSLPFVDERENEDDSMDMEVDSPIPNPDEIILNWRSISAVMETILPYPFDLEKLRT